ncbi:DUF4352 domain-containing protein [Microbacterium sp. ZOR0019]|uniref:DUF4352 domain-containing protein n=1 Tax=Microbacterium sp. ZOR0019 TaxID=1339233 RepID=UPI001E4DC4D8|nr:DUF4352 domain-containing protein [Microbacterium sp. ZOR0019]
MFNVSSCRSGGGISRTRAPIFIAPLIAFAFLAAGCTAAPDVGDSPAPEGTSTTDWTAPADADAEGPTEAPTLTEQSGAIEEPITLSTEMVVAVDDIAITTVKPETPGEYAGSAVVVTISVTNDSKRAQSIDSAVVNLVTDDGDVGIGTTAGPNEPLHGELAAGASAEGTYVFMLDPAKGRSVKISVNYAAGEPLAVFAGQIS